MPVLLSEIPKPNVITPGSGGSANNEIEKFLMMYTCKQCNGRNAQLISKVAYNEGIVVSTCKTCKVNHLIADNLKKLDMAEYGNKIETYLESKGEVVTRMSITPEELENNYLVDRDGVLTLQPKIGGQVSSDSNVIDLDVDRMNLKKEKGFGFESAGRNLLKP
jgi:transcription elongation factor Elf1